MHLGSRHQGCRPTYCSDVESDSHPLASVIKHLVEAAVQAALTQRDDEEAAQWTRAFGPASPKNRKDQTARIIQIASARCLAASMRADQPNKGASRAALPDLVGG